MLAYTYVEHGKFELRDKPRPVLRDARDAIVRVTLASICTSDLHIKHGSVPRAVPGITVGHEMVGIVDEVGEAVTAVRPGDRVTVNVETFCGDCFFCRNGWVNNCTDPEGGWALGCRIDGGQAEYVRVPYADQGLNRIPDGVTDRQGRAGHRVLGGPHCRNPSRRHRADPGCRSHRPVHAAVCAAAAAGAHHCLRPGPRAAGVCARPCAAGAGRPARGPAGGCPCQQPPRRRRCGAGGGGQPRHLPPGLGMCPAQRRGDGGGPL